jgi:hypothetical protein
LIYLIVYLIFFAKKIFMFMQDEILTVCTNQFFLGVFFSRCFLRSVDVFDALQIVTDNHDVFLSIYSLMKIYTYVCIQYNGNLQK